MTRLAVLVLLLLSAPALAQERIDRWAAEATPEGGIATDCENCGDDIGIMMRCTRGSGVARVSLMWAALAAGEEGDEVEVGLDVDGLVERRRATLEFQGALGQVPIVEISLVDPLIAHLSAGRTLTVRTAEGASEVALTGSRRALAILVAACR